MKTLGNKKNSLPALWLLALFLAGSLLLFPLIRPGFFVSDDGEWMIIRLSAFFQSLREGQLPVRFLGRLNHSYGYPVANFLYPGFLYVGSLVHAVGFSFVDTVKILFGISVITAAAGVYFWLRQHAQKVPSAIGTIGFLLSPYIAFDIYRRGSLGEIFALPAIAWSLYSIDANKPKLFALMVGLLIISHNSLALLALVLVGTYLLVTRRIRKFLVPLLLGILLASFYWVPAMVERQYVVFDRTMVANSAQYFLRGSMLGLIGIVNVLAWFFIFLKRKKGDTFFLFSFFIIVALSLPITAYLWNVRFMNALFQFPYRFISLTPFLGGWLIAMSIQRLGVNYAAVVGALAIIWVAQLTPALLQVDHIVRPEGYYTTNEATTTVHDEYMPIWVEQKPTERAQSRIEFFSGAGTITPEFASTQQMKVIIEAKEQSIVQINSIYYPGWGVLLNGLPVPIEYKNSQGLMRVFVPAGNHMLVAEFRETAGRFIADLLSAAAGIAWVSWAFWRRPKSKRGHL